MAETSTIEWTDATWQPITGCAVVSAGCTNCYAMRLAGTRLRKLPSRVGLTRPSKAGPVWTGDVRLNEKWLTQPLTWRQPKKIFVCAHGDLFAEAVPDAWIDRVFAVMALAPQHTFQVLTKRSARMRAYMKASDLRLRVQNVVDTMEPDGVHQFADHEPWIADDFPLPNVWLGVSTENQRRADERVPDLLATPAAVRFVSAEPLLSGIDFTRIIPRDSDPLDAIDALRGVEPYRLKAHWHRLDWVIVGGESGPGARPMRPDWARQIRDACGTAGVAFLHKQNGVWEVNGTGHAITGRPVPGSGRLYDSITFPDGLRMNRVGRKAAGRLLDGELHDAMPEARR